MRLQTTPLARSSFAVLAALGAAVGCGRGTSSTMGPVRPSAVGTLSRAQAVRALPAQLQNDPTISIATIAGSPSLVAGRAGVFQLGDQAATSISEDKALAMASVAGVGVLVATSAGLKLWDGTAFVDSPIASALGGGSVLSLAERSGQIWIGTSADLFVLDHGNLVSLPDVAHVTKLWAASGANDVIAITESGETIAIRDVGGTFSKRPLSGEIAGTKAIIPAAEDRVFAIAAGGELVERVAVSATGIEWLPVALTMDQSDGGAKGISALAVDPVSADAWVVADGSLVRIQGDVVGSMEAPSAMGAPIAAAATIDGTLWISDGTSLFSFASSDVPAPDPTQPPPGMTVTYTNAIATFSHDNCDRCHSQSAGVAFPLTSYEAWSQNIDLIIPALREKRMPKDGRALVGGSVTVIEQWKSQGLMK
jgi:hypothetical protein